MDDFVIWWEGDYYVIVRSPDCVVISDDSRYKIHEIHGKWAGVTCHNEPGIGFSTYHTSNGQSVGDYVYVTPSDRYDIEQQSIESIDEHARTREITMDAASTRRHSELALLVQGGVGAVLLLVLGASWVWWVLLGCIAMYTDARTSRYIESTENAALASLEKSIAFVDNRRNAARELLRALEKVDQFNKSQ